MSTRVSEQFSNNGPLAASFPHYRVRNEQVRMAEAVQHALEDSSVLITEAGTGVGKTFAYMVPSLLHGGKTIISTGTKTLQDQLFFRDIPSVQNALNLSRRVSLLKGRSNYLCRYRLHRFLEEGVKSKKGAAELQAAKQWEVRTDTGDLAEFTGMDEQSQTRFLITSTSENCLGSECPDYQKCFVVKARKNAQEADIVVINHHLFFADTVLKEEGFGELLPGANNFVFDEAHQLPDLASQFFSKSWSGRQLTELIRDIRAELFLAAEHGIAESQIFNEVEECLQKIRKNFPAYEHKISLDEIRDKHSFIQEIENLSEKILDMQDVLVNVQDKSKGLQRCLQRTKSLADVVLLAENFDDNEQFCWVDILARTVRVHMTPLNVADIFRNHLESYPASWIFTSATLSVRDGLGYFANLLGIKNYDELSVGSPFEYEKNALLYVPHGLPEPNQPEYLDKYLKEVIQIINQIGGRTFCLFTSHAALRKAASILQDSIKYPVLVQGDLPKGELLDRFVEHGDAVLVGTQTFWEGVDIRGSTLSCVMIDRLPFASPQDPLVKAKVEQLRKNGCNPFNLYQVPQAIIQFKQGIGRLIRDDQDVGLLVVGDPRLVTKSYGKLFVDSIPPIPLTRDKSRVENFLRTRALLVEEDVSA